MKKILRILLVPLPGVPLPLSWPTGDDGPTIDIFGVTDWGPGPGGVCKLAFRRAIEKGYDYVAVLQSDPVHLVSALPELLEILEIQGDAGGVAVLGQRTKLSYVDPRQWVSPVRASLIQRLTGMRPLVGKSHLRIYRTRALQRVMFELNTNGAHFETELWFQLDRIGYSVLGHLPANPIRSQVAAVSRDDVKAALKYRLQKANLFYDFLYHPEWFLAPSVEEPRRDPAYEFKFEGDTPHTFVTRRRDLGPPRGSRVLDLGCSTGALARWLAQ